MGKINEKAFEAALNAGATVWAEGNWGKTVRVAIEAYEAARAHPVQPPTHKELAEDLKHVYGIKDQAQANNVAAYLHGRIELAQRPAPEQPRAWTRKLTKLSSDLYAVRAQLAAAEDQAGFANERIKVWQEHTGCKTATEAGNKLAAANQACEEARREAAETQAKCERCTQHWMGRAEKDEAECAKLDRNQKLCLEVLGANRCRIAAEGALREEQQAHRETSDRETSDRQAEHIQAERTRAERTRAERLAELNHDLASALVKAEARVKELEGELADARKAHPETPLAPVDPRIVRVLKALLPGIRYRICESESVELETAINALTAPGT